MKLSRIQIKGFQGIMELGVVIEPPVLVVSGPNGSGKTSLVNAIQFALDGSSGRVSKKGDYDTWLVHENLTESNKAFVSVTMGDTEYQRQVATGHVTGDDEPDFPLIMPWLLGTQHLSTTPHKTAARVLLKAAQVPMSREDIVKRLLAEGVDEERVAEISIYLRRGFDAAMKESKQRESVCRGEWKGITGETYGVKKAGSWQPDVSDADLRKSEINVEILATEKSKDKLIEKRDQAAEEGDAGIPVSGMDCGNCPECDTPLRYNSGKLYVRDPENEKKPQPKTEDVHGLNRLISACDQKIGNLNQRMMDIDQEVANAVNTAKKAKVVHKTLQGWNKLTALLSPTGIQMKIMAEALAPIQERINQTCEITGWPDIEIQPDLSVFFNQRPYALASESEQWRVNTAIAEALAYVSGIKLFVVDRMDVLGPPDRVPFIKWLTRIQGDHDTIIVLATLKAPPPAPAGFASLWLGPPPKEK